LSANAYQTAVQKFSQERFLNDLLLLYEKWLANG
jgi:hypothetical protein